MLGMIAWFARNEVAANLLMGIILALGAWTLAERIPLEVFPEFERDTVSITLTWRGATPAEVEEAVVVRVEEAIADLEGIERITSSAYEGAGRVLVEVAKERDPRELLDDIKNRVDAISSFPDEVERPIYAVSEFRREVISVAVSGALPEAELRRLGEQVRDEIAALPEVSLVELTGTRPYEISIEISERTLDRYGLTFDQVVDAVRRSSGDQPAGSIKTRGGEILLRTKGQAYSGSDFAAIPLVSRSDGGRLTLGEIATLHDGFNEEPSDATFNGRPAVLIEVYRSGRQNAITVADAVRGYLDTAQARMPPEIHLDYWRDRSRIVKLRLETLLNSAWQGGLLVFLCLTLFLRLSVAFWVCAGIPVSFMGALMVMPELGLTLNLVSLFSFILVLGIVVDDAIITGENIYRHLRRDEGGLDAVVRGAQEVAMPVTFGLLTTLAAFLPLMFLGGLRGPIFAQIPMIVIPVLIFSWIESKLILPAHLRHLRVNRAAAGGGIGRLQHRVADGLEWAVATFYRPLLERALEYRYLTLALFVAGSLVALSFVISGRYGFTFFPRVQSETARATLTMQTGTPEAVTRAQIERMTSAAQALRDTYRDPESGESVIRNILASVGWSAGGGPANPDASGRSEVGQVSLELVPPEERTLAVTTSALVSEWRNAIGAVPGAKEVSFRAEIGRGGAPIEVQLTGHDFDRMQAVAAQVRRRLAEYPGVFDIQDSFEDGKAEIALSLRPEGQLLGLTTTDLGRQVRQAFFGAEAQRVQRGREDVRVMVRYPEAERRSLAALDEMRIRTGDGAEVPIAHVADLTLGQGFATIRRDDRRRAVSVSADVNKEAVDVNAIAADLRPFLERLVAENPGVGYGFEGELKEQRESFQSLFYAVGMVLFTIYALLAVPLRSYAQPIVVMLVIPFSIVGALLGHFALGMSLSIISIMGMLALSGVVVNDSLVLVHWINKKRDEGLALARAVREAGVARFRPILLTSLTTFAGLAPLIWEKSTQAQFLIPMAVSLGFGILYATLLSLLLVPVGYLIMEDLKRPFRRRAAGLAPTVEAD